MLSSLHVKNLALIQEAEVEFGPGLNILTGETGAGKSILIGSINLALGKKLSREMIREGADSALVELVFETENPKVEQALKENLSGLYNLVNNESISKFDLCLLFNKYFRAEEVEINPDDKLQLDKSLRRRRNDFSFVVPSYEQQVREMREWVDVHKDLYPHYNVK